MKTLLKALGALLAVIVVLVVAAAVIVPMVLDPEDLKARLVSEVREQTGRELRIGGEIGVSVFPWLGLELGAVELGNAPGFAAPFFARSEQVSVRVKLMPLLERRLEMDTVTVRGLALHLARDARGRGNWEDLVAAGGPGEREAPAGGEAGPGLAALAIGGLDLRDASLTWDDARAGQRIEIKGLELRTGAIAPGQPVELELGFDLRSAAPELSGRVDLGATLTVDAAAQRLSAKGLKVEADLSGPDLPGGKARLTLGGDLEADAASRSVRIERLALAGLGLRAEGRAEVSVAGEGRLAAELAVAEFSPRTLLEALGQALPETADPKALSRASLRLRASGTLERVAVEPLEIALDDTRLTGKLSIARPAAPAIGFDLALDAIDLDRYLPPPGKDGKAAAGTPTPASGAAGAGGALPLETLRALDLDGRLRAGRVRASGLTVTEVAATVRAKGGLIELRPLTARLYQGSYQGAVTIDARKDTPLLAFEERIAKVRIGPLLGDLTGVQRLTGTAEVSARLRARGADLEAIQRTLNGEGAFSIRDGAYRGVNIARMIREAMAKLQGRTLPAEQGELKTDFTEISGTVQVRDGVASNRDLRAKTPLLRVTGKGSANLPARTLDYRVVATVVATTAGQGGDDLKDLAGMPIPLQVTGSFAEPSFGVDLQALAKALARSQAKGLLGGGSPSGVTETIKKKAGSIGGALKGLTKGLFGN